MKNSIFFHLFVLAGLTLYSCGKPSTENVPACCAGKKTAGNISGVTKTDRSLSLYQLHGKWTTQDNRTVSLNELQGKTVVTAMIFTHCGYACPRIVDNMKAIESRLPAGIRDKTVFLLISFDTDRDNPAQLKAFASLKQLDDHWTLLQGNPSQVRELSMLLNMQYEKLADGNFNHSNIITILDSGGAIVTQVEGLNPNISAAVSLVSQTAAEQ